MPEISLDKCLTLNSTDISQWNYNSTQLNSTGYYGCRCKHLYIRINVSNIFKNI